MRKKVFFLPVALTIISFLLAACSVRDQNLPTPELTLVSVQKTDLPTQTITPEILHEPTIEATPTATSDCLTQAGTTEQIEFPSSEMDETFTATVYLPPCYDPSLVSGYPVVYLLHGQNMDDTYWPSIGATTAADQAIRSGHSPFMMVFPNEVHNWDSTSESKFGIAVSYDLIPWVEAHYNICTLRQCRAIGGLSRGGGWAMHIALIHFDDFSSIGAHSPGFFLNDFFRPESLLTTHSITEFPRIYIDRGDQDFLFKGIDRFDQNLTFGGIEHVYEINSGDHIESYWRSEVQNYINWYAQGFDNLNP